MAMTRFKTGQALHFSGLNAPVMLDNADTLLPVIKQVMPGWPLSIRKPSPDASAFLTISGSGDDLFESVLTGSASAAKRRNAVDCVCHMVAEAAWEQIRSHPLWLCLHCAAVEFSGRLVLFPNRHRAGKSTLSAILAARGNRVFTDDYLPVEIDATGTIFGRANGVAPRIRLPVPDDFSRKFRNWAELNPGPENERYKYLESEQLPKQGERLPIGAVVILDRETSPLAPALTAATSTDTMDVLIRQNFARNLHAGRILQASRGVTETANLYRLSYFSAEEAADMLERRFRSWQAPVRNMTAPEHLQREQADLAVLDEVRPALETSAAYQQANGTTEVAVDGCLYLSDPVGLSIQKLNPVSAAIWRLLEQSATINEVTDILFVAFPDIGREKIQTDTGEAIGNFVKKRLIVPAYQSAIVAE